MTIVVLDGIIKCQKDDTYNFSVRFKEQEDAQYWKDIINQVLTLAGVETEVQTCYFDERED